MTSTKLTKIKAPQKMEFTVFTLSINSVLEKFESYVIIYWGMIMMIILSCRVSFNHTRITIGQCDSNEQFSLLQCSTSILTSECNSDMVGWVECSLSGKLIIIILYYLMPY